MRGYLIFGCILFVSTSFNALASEVCCPEVGCFQTDGPYKHLPKPKCVEKFGVTFGLYTKENRNNPKNIERTGDIPEEWHKTKGRVVFIVHGYRNDFESSYMIGIKDRLLDEENARVIKVDWKEGANSVYYPNSASNTRTVGAEIALITQRLSKDVAYIEPWCIGFSLGAHVCGFAGQNPSANVVLSRITGLDPAGPWFSKYDPVARLNPDCAKFVDVIHTDGDGLAAYYGLMTPSGHVDFYPNGGKNQPGCWTEMPRPLPNARSKPSKMSAVSCSHSRAYKFFMESFDGCFVASQKCDEPNKIPKKTCSPCVGSDCPKMGYYADHTSSLRGLYFLETRSKSPYCLS